MPSIAVAQLWQNDGFLENLCGGFLFYEL